MTPGAVPAGRDEELEQLDGFLDSIANGLTGAILTGPSGIGKTTVWKEVIARAQARGLRVSVARPNEAETRLPFATLTDILGPVSSRDLNTLPHPQRHALEAAMHRARTRHGAQPLAVALALGHLLRLFAERTPLLLAIDDASWIDPPSSRVLEFALRRLQDEPIGVLLTHRTAAGERKAPPLAEVLPAGRLFWVEIGPLGVDAIDEVLRLQAGIHLVRPTIKRVHAVADGNPLYAIEIGRDLVRRGELQHEPAQASGALLPVPESLSELIAHRLAALAPGVEEILLVAAASAAPTVPTLLAASGRAGRSRLAVAVDAGILQVEGNIVRFAHPLLAAHVYAHASPDRRSTTHLRLAQVVAEPEERASHLALSTPTANARVARELETAAGIARARGAPEAAAHLEDRAASLTPPSSRQARRRRLIAAANDLLSAGDISAARGRLERLTAEAGTGPARADVLLHLANVLMFTGDRLLAARAIREASRHADGSAKLRVRIESGLAGVAYLTWRNWRAGATHAATAARLAGQARDQAMRIQTIGHLATWQFALGRGLRDDLVAAADRLRTSSGAVHLAEHPDLQFASILGELGEVHEARGRLQPLVIAARARGDWNSLPMLLSGLAKVEIHAGDWQVAEKLFAEADNAARQTGQEPGNSRDWPGEVLALRGDVPGARADAAAAIEWARGTRQPWLERSVNAALGLMELSRLDAEAAERTLRPMIGARFPGWTEPAIQRAIVPAYTDALVDLGRLDEAAVILEGFERAARSRMRVRALADALRTRARLLSARMRGERALATVDEAIELQRSLGLPFDLARSLLAAGEIRRRARKKADARASLEEAGALFDHLGAVLWKDRVLSELARTGLLRTAGSGLTNMQRDVAALVAQGLTNREIAATLFVSIHTVEAHLSSAYRSLGIRSRTELARFALTHDLTPLSSGDPTSVARPG